LVIKTSRIFAIAEVRRSKTFSWTLELKDVRYFFMYATIKYIVIKSVNALLYSNPDVKSENTKLRKM